MELLQTGNNKIWRRHVAIKAFNRLRYAKMIIKYIEKKTQRRCRGTKKSFNRLKSKHFIYPPGHFLFARFFFFVFVLAYENKIEKNIWQPF